MHYHRLLKLCAQIAVWYIVSLEIQTSYNQQGKVG